MAPKGDWYDFSNDRRYRRPAEVEVAAPLDRIPFSYAAAPFIATRPVVQYVSQSPIDPLTFAIYPVAPSGPAAAAPTSSRNYYEDDGISFDFQHGVSLQQKISVKSSSDTVEVHMTAREGSCTPPARALLFRIHVQRQAPWGVIANWQALEQKASMDALEKAGSRWAYDTTRTRTRSASRFLILAAAQAFAFRNLGQCSGPGELRITGATAAYW
jgi:alpha-glucosidase